MQSAQNQNAAQSAQSAYQQGMLQYQNDQLAFQMAQGAYSDAMSMGNAYGYAPGGNYFSWPTGGQPNISQPLPGTSTLGAQNQWFNQAQQAAGMTGYFNNPQQWQYQPGTFVVSDTSQGGNGAVGQVLPNGQIQQLSAQDAQAMGYKPELAAHLMGSEFNNMQIASQGGRGLGQGQTVQTIQAQQAAAAMAAQQAGQTGIYQTPTQTPQQWWSTLDNATKNAYLVQNSGDQQAAMNAYAAVQGHPADQATLQMQAMYGGYGIPQSGQLTQSMQQQLWNQQYQTAQFGLQTQQAQQQAAQQYLGLLSQLQGPADYGQYLKVLGSTPSGLSDLVGAAAGRYVPGTGTSGAAPQAQTLQNLVGAATGYAGGGSGANAAGAPAQGGQTGVQQGNQQPGQGTASPGGQNYADFMATAQGLVAPSQIAPQSFNAMSASQKQMLGSMYGNLGYAPMDINSMYQQSLPKYAAGSAAGNMKLV